MLNGSKKVRAIKSMNSDNLDDMQMCHKKKRVRLHITAVKKHVSPIELEEICDSDEKDGENFDDCYLKFNKVEKSARLLLASSGNLSHDRVPTLDGDTLNLNYELFKGDALIFDDLKSDEVTICSKKSSKSITLQAKGFPFWGIWTPSQGGAPLLCIEPWQGHADFEDFSGDITQKDGIHKIAVGQSYGTNYTFIVNE